MMHPARLRLWALLVVLPLAACGPSTGASSTKSAVAPPKPASHLVPGGALAQSGPVKNGLIPNGLIPNGLIPNGLIPNGLAVSGLLSNGISGHGLLEEQLTQANVLSNAVIMEQLRSDLYARKFFQYLYSCAMPPGQELGLDLDGNPETGDGHGYDLVVDGLVGLAPQWGQSGGSCDESCQRWVSACMIARTNVFGATVQLSMRAPNLSGSPDWPLEVLSSSEEAQTYNRREGSYFGNLFATTTLDGGTKVWSPTLNACAGPNSDIPYLSLRFCSSLEDDCPIDSVANCAENTNFSPSACDTTLGPSGESTNCYVDPHNKTPAGLYQQVITVYLNQNLTSVCGNHICETQGAETNETCPADCSSNTWANQIEMGTGMSAIAFNGPLSLTNFEGWANFGLLTVDKDSDVLIGGYSDGDVNLGDGAVSLGRGRGYLAKYTSDGTLVWGDRIGADVNAVATDPDGNFGVLATVENGVSSGRVYDKPGSSSFLTVPTTTGANEVLLVKLLSNGDRAWAVTFGGPGSGTLFSAGDDRASRAIAAAPDGSWYVAGSFYGTGNFGGGLTSAGNADVFLTKVLSDGTPKFGVQFGGTGDDRPSGLTVDGSGNVLLTTLENNVQTKAIYLLDPDGAVKWNRRFPQDPVTGAQATFHKAIFDGDGNVAVAGSFNGKVDFGAGMVDGGSSSFFLAIYDFSGALKVFQSVPGNVVVQDLMVDGYKDLLVFGQYDGTGIDFGAGPFTSRDPDSFLVSYKPDGTFVWASPLSGYGNNIGQTGDKQRGAKDDSALFTGIGLDGKGRLVGTGVMDGFLLFDNRMLVNWVAPLSYDADSFVGAFDPPCSDDGCDSTPPVFVPDSIPEPILAQASKAADVSGPAGADVTFNLPIATDQDNAGRFGTATVACVPSSGSRFPIGDTDVLCTATDAHGNHTFADFKVTVENKAGPTIVGGGVQNPIVTQNPAGAAVTYGMPTASDQVDGPGLQVICNPPIRTVFPVGVTQVVCTATDKADNTAQGGFPVWVVLASDGKNPPGQPKNVAAVPGIRSATVSWDGVPTARSYRVLASDGKNQTTVDGSNSSAVVSGLANGAKLTFTVTAIDGAQLSTTSLPSAQVQILDVPAKPAGIGGLPGVKQVQLTWAPPPSDGGAPIREYRVETYDGDSIIRRDHPTGTSLTVTGLADGRTYHFNVYAINDVGAGTPAQIDVATPTVPGAPTNLVATAGVRQISLTWTAPSSDGGRPITSYQVDAYSGNALVQSLQTAVTNAVVTGLTNGTPYTVVVRALNAVGYSGSASTAVTVPNVPSQPTNVTATPGVRQVSLAWGAPSMDGGLPITGYQVEEYASGNYVQTLSTTDTTLVVSGLNNGGTYSFVVRAVNNAGVGTSGPTGAVTLPNLPGAPTNVTASPGVRQVSLSWSPPSSDGGTAIWQYRVDCYSGGSLVTSVWPRTTSVSVTGLADVTAYSCTVAAVNGVGRGPAVTAPTVTTLPTLPGAPTNVAASPGVRRVSLSWSPPSSDGGSAIWQYRVDCYSGGLLVTSVWPRTTSVSVTGLADVTAYSCTVAAVNGVGRGPAAAAPTVTTLPTLPGAPTNVTASPGVRRVSLSWLPPSSDGGSAIWQYRVDCYSGGSLVASVWPKTTSVSVTGLADVTAYSCTVAAVNGVGRGPATTAPTVTTQPNLPGAPTNLTASPGVRQVSLSWSPPSSDGGSAIWQYRVDCYSGGTLMTSVWPRTTSVSVAGLADATAYSCTVAAVNGVGRGPAATAPTVTTSP